MNFKLLCVSLLFAITVRESAAQAQESAPDRVADRIDRAAKATGASKSYGPVRRFPKGPMPEVTLHFDGILYNGTKLKLGASANDWRSAIGRDAVCSGPSESEGWCTWDSLGIDLRWKGAETNEVEQVTLHFSHAADDEQPLKIDGKALESPWIAKGNFPGRLVIDGFGIDRVTKFWEIRESVPKARRFRCGLRSCQQPHGIYGSSLRIYMVLDQHDENGTLQEFTVSRQ